MNENMKKAREAAGLSQKQVALTLQVSAPTVSDWEAGKISPSAAKLKELSKLYNSNVNYLLGLTSERYYSEETSQRICDAIVSLREKSPTAFSGFIIPHEIWRKISDRSYQFSDVTFPQFAEVLGVTLEDFIDPYSEPELKAAFFGGYSDELTKDEIDALWDDAKDYMRFKIEQKKKQKE